jgi:16S rRNA G966 N2-methylase RsmD
MFWSIICADIEKLEFKNNMKFDAIVTDPPYEKQHLPLWETLARRALDWLKDDGLLVTIAPHQNLPAIINILSKYLQYQWICGVFQPGPSGAIWGKKISIRYKPVLVYSKPGLNLGDRGWWFNDAWTSAEVFKRYHKWGQSKETFIGMIDVAGGEGLRILDPFVGGGTCGMAAYMMGAELFIGADINEEICQTAEQAIADFIKEYDSEKLFAGSQARIPSEDLARR